MDLFGKILLLIILFIGVPYAIYKNYTLGRESRPKKSNDNLNNNKANDDVG